MFYNIRCFLPVRLMIRLFFLLNIGSRRGHNKNQVNCYMLIKIRIIKAIIPPIGARIVTTFFTLSLKVRCKILNRRIPIKPPMVFKITSSISDAPTAKLYWNISTQMLIHEMIIVWISRGFLLISSGRYIPIGIKITMFPNKLLIAKD